MAADASGDPDGKRTAQLKLKEKEAALKKYITKTGQDYQSNRTQVVGFGHSQASQAVWTQRKAPLPKTARTSDTTLQNTLRGPRIKGIIPQGATIENVRIIAGAGTSTKLRYAETLENDHGGPALQWQKKGGIIESNHKRYDVHWDELNGIQYNAKMKGERLK